MIQVLECSLVVGLPIDIPAVNELKLIPYFAFRT